MRLSEWIEKNKVTRSAFADKIGVAPSYITSICNGGSWPSRTVAQKIIDATKGKVTANDFLD